MPSYKTNARVAVAYQEAQYAEQAKRLSQQLNIPMLEPDGDMDFILNVTEAGLALQSRDPTLGKPIRIDFLAGKTNHRRLHGGGRGQLIAKACAVKGQPLPTILDATAGLGQDAFVLACLGCEVHMLERSPIVAVLLQDGLNRLQAEESMPLRLIQMDAISYLTQAKADEFDVVYLDPMFPARQKNAKVKKEMQVLQALLGKVEEDEAAIFAAAKRVAKKRVAVKRPRGAPHYANTAPSFEITGKSSRFDIYLT